MSEAALRPTVKEESSSITDRRLRLLAGLDLQNTRGIEIGPLASPIVRKSESDVRYVDHTDRASLVAKYAGDVNVDTKAIVDVDVIWGERTLAESFEDELGFDYVIASHVIEHVPDMVGWLREIAAVLRPGGRVHLAIPDKRYTFDHFRRTSSLAEVIGAYLERSRRPTPAQIFDQGAYFSQVDPTATLAGPLDPATHLSVPKLREALATATAVAQEAQYLDVHCWVFTPRSLLETLVALVDLGLLPFRCVAFHITEPGDLEMMLVLQTVDVDEPNAALKARQSFIEPLERLPSVDGAPAPSDEPCLAAALKSAPAPPIAGPIGGKGIRFPYSKDATRLLAGLKGLEVGGGAHNPFGLETINLDRSTVDDNACKQLEIEFCGEAMPVNVVAFGDALPFGDQSFDFVISSHVIEYFYDPVKALREWCRVSRRYVFIICPHKERAGEEDRQAAETTPSDLRHRMASKGDPAAFRHQTFWTMEGFISTLNPFLPAGWRLAFSRDPDDKVGNGFTVVFERRERRSLGSRIERALRFLTPRERRLEQSAAEFLSARRPDRGSTEGRMNQHADTFLELEALGQEIPPYRPTYAFKGQFINASHRAIASYPLKDSVLIQKKSHHRRGEPIPGWLRREDALKLYELAFFADGEVLEFGCHHGLSTSILAEAVRDSHRRRAIHTVDIVPAAIAATQQTLRNLGLHHLVETRCDDAIQAARTLAGEGRRFAFIFIDQDTSFPSVHGLCQELESLTRPGAFCLFHDINDVRNADPACTEYDAYCALMQGLSRDLFEFWGIYGCTALFRRQ